MAEKYVRYTDQFKADAVALVKSGMTQSQVIKDLGISKSALGKWVVAADLRERGITPPTDVEERKELAIAMRRIRELEQENEVLRRAAAYLSQANLKSPK
jgi:transposase